MGSSVCVFVQMDNQVVRSYLNHQGDMCTSLFLLAQQICLWTNPIS